MAPLIPEVECPACYGIVPADDSGTDQISECRDCGRLYHLTYDASQEPGRGWQGGYHLRELTPSSDSEIQGDLRYHERN
jgi:hypothetical protein